ncbi:MerR family transcriptional regulator [Guptibacillus hwajinpoensis]|uniref:MerR family transcriptional regulator n=1 Tax=Guptibacillus hwajinpoensis TaxID=208199 RepID=UPI001CD5642D|nr:MerR family transcriptional regulator [Pseudalkalibacillus hwajinpoensis]MCA0990675.1 MerR family transcriptional regulator [Pseudalkalibacillus hwajinpoensis]
MNNTMMISRVASMLNVSRHTLKLWEEQFAPFLTIPRDENNARTYTIGDIEVLQLIKNMKESHAADEVIINTLELQGKEAEKTPPSEPIDQVDIQTSLSKIVSFVESAEVKKLLSMDETVKRLEKDIVHQVHEIVHEEIATASDAHASINQMELNAIGKKIDHLADVSVDEREFYQFEVTKERQIADEQMSAREERLMAVVQDRFRDESRAHDPKWGVTKIKNIFGFAK